MVRPEPTSLTNSQNTLSEAVYFEQSNQPPEHGRNPVSNPASNSVSKKTKTTDFFNTDYDVAVIGSGIAGLTSAAYLAKDGLKVIVLERDVHPGGCAASFKHQNYQFAVGATVAMGFEPTGLHRKIYNDLGLVPDFVNVNPAIRVHLPDRSLSLFTQRDAWHKELKRVFPIHSKNILAFWHEIENIAAVMDRVSKHFPVMPFKHLDDVLDTLKGFHPNLITLLPLLRSTVQDLLKKHNLLSDDVELTMFKAFIDGQLLDAMQTDASNCVLTSGAYALDIYRFGCQYKVGGLDSIAYDLCDYIEMHGGSISFSTRVKSILNIDKQVQGIVTNRGTLNVPVVVSAIPLQNTAELLEHKSDSTLAAIAQKQDYTWGAFTLYLGVDESALPEDVHYFEQISGPSSHSSDTPDLSVSDLSVSDLSVSKHDVTNMLISISPPWDNSRAPEGKRAITISTHVDAKAWLNIANISKEVYTAEKQKLEETILTKLASIFPNIRSGLEVILSGSPRTFKRFTLRSDGLVGGFPQDLKHANFQAPSHRSDIKGLFLAGDTIFPGQGTLGTSVSGFNAARSAKRYQQRHVPVSADQNINQQNASQQNTNYSQ